MPKYEHSDYRRTLFCRAFRHQSSDQQEGRQRDILPCQPQGTLVYGGLRDGGSIDLGCHLRLCARNGALVADDLFADVSGIHRGLSGDCLCAITALLSPEPHEHLHLLRTALGRAILSDGSQFLPVVEDDGSSSQILCGLHHLATVRVRASRYSFCNQRGSDGAADMALHTTWRHWHIGVYGYLPDTLSVYGSDPDHPVGGLSPEPHPQRGSQGGSRQSDESYLRV